MRALLLAASLLLPAARAARADDAPKLQRYLADLRLGDDLETVRRVYPPAQEWPKTSKPGAPAERYRVEKAWAKAFPRSAQTLYVGFRRGRLVEIEIVYDARLSARQPVDKLAGEYALIYGEPQRTAERFWWSDGRTVLRVFSTEVPDPRAGPKAVGLRTSVQVFDRRAFESGK
jgi:hypothetical protein